MKRLDRIRGTLDAATQKPWERTDTGSIVAKDGDGSLSEYIFEWHGSNENDMDLAVAARSDLDWLEGWARRAKPLLREFADEYRSQGDVSAMDQLISELAGEE